MLAEQRLDLGGKHAHAAHLQHLLAPAEEVQEALRVQHTDIAGVEPAAAERLRAGLRLVPVALSSEGERTRISPSSPSGSSAPVSKSLILNSVPGTGRPTKIG